MTVVTSNLRKVILSLAVTSALAFYAQPALTAPTGTVEGTDSPATVSVPQPSKGTDGMIAENQAMPSNPSPWWLPTPKPTTAPCEISPEDQARSTKYKTVGGIGTKWRKAGGEVKWGTPIMNEANAANGGRYQEFMKAHCKTTIYWHPSTGAHIVDNSTAIGLKFIKEGRERGLGFPSTEERKIDGGVYQVFVNGQKINKVLWSSMTGAHAIQENGAIGQAWMRNGYERGWGWPITSEYMVNGHVDQWFTSYVRAHWSPQRGLWTTNDGRAWRTP